MYNYLVSSWDMTFTIICSWTSECKLIITLKSPKDLISLTGCIWEGFISIFKFSSRSLDISVGLTEPYNSLDPNLIKKRAKLVKENEKFSQNILTALREIAEEKEQSKSQEDIYAEESIYTKFTSNKDTALFPAWHSASWKDKLNLLDKFEDKRLVGFGKKIIYQEAPEVLPKDMLKSIKREIAKRILSERHEKWWTIPTCFNEIDTLRDKYTNENDQEKLKTRPLK